MIVVVAVTFNRSILIDESAKSTHSLGISLVVQGLRLHLPMTGGVGVIPDQGAKILHAEGQLSPCAPTTEPAHSRACAPE